MSEDVKVGETPTENKSSLRPFQKRRQLERDIEHITAEMYKRNRELSETNKTLSLLRNIDALVLESHTSLTVVTEHITEAITQATDYPFVGLLTRESLGNDEVVLNGSSSGAGLGKTLDPDWVFSKRLRIPLTHPWLSQFDDKCIINIAEQADEDVAKFLGCTVAAIQKAYKQLPIKALYVLKLQARRQIVGLLVVGYLLPPDRLNPGDLILLDRLSDSIGVALDNKLLFEENQRVLKQLKETNKRLRELDESKDEFISMASHQLRTPLTSVKGYISMVLEGDAGKLTHMQREMLGQAFFSSQRMVYLIADLLNVSRLKTGKFLIEPIMFNLADMVEQELDQLEETAQSHSLTLNFDKPKSFPSLMLDETKTRQVIMNLVDNAIYYTPAGGHIEVKLINKPASVELRVVDDGIGVPKHERPHLFTKFYRAGNARKVRPDGTGLGLFMAKKVVVAQGGSIIFDSVEGKGSTFGFVFNKSKLAAEPPPVKAEAKPAAAVSK